MTWIQTIAPETASPELRTLYEQVADPVSGQLDNIMLVHGLHPAGLRAHFELYRAVMAGSKGLRKVERELIALVVSQINECHY